MQEQSPVQFYVGNYHSKKSLSSAVSLGKKVKILPIPLTNTQIKENKEYSALYGNSGELPHILHSPCPTQSYEIQGSFNKQVPLYFATVMLDEHCNISRVE